ncbi:hypothetical protein V5799_025705 [Amblyomma americanum]|uniref:AXH domain-containing protein n=1 Tax=Amblyomma americanum TaxID=6943 RepID=A0AAQ4E8H8_AMBAM
MRSSRPCAATRASMLSLRQPEYLSPLCGGGGPERKVRSASEGGHDWAPMSGAPPVEAPPADAWFRPPDYSSFYPRFPFPLAYGAPPASLLRRPYPTEPPPLPPPPPAFPARRRSPPSPPYRLPSGKEGSLKHRILQPPASINIVEPPASLLAGAPLSAPPVRSRAPEGPQLAVPASSSSSSSQAPGALHYPAYFVKGSIIQLGSGLLKKVEDLRTEDFVSSANLSRDLRIDSSRVLRVAEAPSKGDGVALLSFSVGQNQVQVTVEAPVEHPFFVFNRGWSSCNPERSLQRYQLQCHRLAVGDVCISLTHRARRTGLPPRPPPAAPGADPMNPLSIREPAPRKRRWSAPDQVAPVSERTT